MSKFVQRLLFISLSFVLIIALTACGGSDSASSDDEVELTVWLWSGMGLDELIEQYEEENNVKINVQLADFNDVHTNLTTSLAAGSGAPDVSAVEVKGIENMLGNPQHFHNLYDLGAEEVRDDYLDWKWQQAESIDGEILIGLPTDIGPQALAYRIDVFEEAGLPTDREEVAQLIQTWDDFVEVGKQVRERTGKAMVDSPTGVFAVITGQSDEKYFDADGEIIVDSNPHIKKAYDYAIHMIEEDIVTPFDQWSTEWGTGMNNGDFATILAPAWMMTFMQDTAPDAAGMWDVTDMPEGSGNWGGSFLTIPKESKQPEEAYKFIKWLLAPEQQLATFNTHGNFPSTPVLFDSEELQSFESGYFNNAPVGQIYARAAEQVVPVFEGPESIQVEGILNDAVNRVRNGQSDPESSWQTAMEQLERELRR